MLKRRQDGSPNFPIFVQKTSKNSSYDGLWSKMPLGSLQEPAKSLPRASQEPSKSPQEAFHSLHKPPIRLPRYLPEPAVQTILHAWAEGKTSNVLLICAGASKIIPISIPKRLQNRAPLGYSVGAPKVKIFNTLWHLQNTALP